MAQDILWPVAIRSLFTLRSCPGDEERHCPVAAVVFCIARLPWRQPSRWRESAVGETAAGNTAAERRPLADTAVAAGGAGGRDAGAPSHGSFVSRKTTRAFSSCIRVAAVVSGVVDRAALTAGIGPTNKAPGG